jgi:hypothetical protein
MTLRHFALAALGLVLAGPLAAQTTMCGGLAAQGTWINGSEGASDIATSPEAFDGGGFAGSNEAIVSLFSTSQPLDGRVEAKPQPGQDTVIVVDSAGGMLLLSDDDGGGGLASRAETNLAPGSYCLVTRGIEGSPVTAEVRVGRLEHPALTDGGMITEDNTGCTANTPATTLGMGPIDGSLASGIEMTGSVDDTPFYRFDLAGTQSLSITATNADADPVITLYDANGLLIAENDDFDGLNSRIDMTDGLAPGTYCIGVRALNDTALPITLAVTSFSEADYLAGLYDRAEAAPPLDGSHPIEDLGELQNRLRADTRVGDAAQWIKFDIWGESLVVIDAIALDQIDPVLTLFDDLGRQVGYNDDGGPETLDSMLAARVSTGTYLLAVSQVGGADSGTSGRIRVAIERYVRAN